MGVQISEKSTCDSSIKTCYRETHIINVHANTHVEMQLFSGLTVQNNKLGIPPNIL